MKRLLATVLSILCIGACSDDNTSEAPDNEKKEQNVTCTLSIPDKEQVSMCWALPISGDASADTGKIQKASLWIDDKMVEEFSAVPFRYHYFFPQELEPGTLKIELKVEGDQGGSASQIRTVKTFDDGKPRPNVVIECGEMTDPRDGKTYRTVTLGEQTWMGENLKYFPEQHTTLSMTEPRYYIMFDSDIKTELGKAYLDVMGAFYNHAAALDGDKALKAGESRQIRGVCPEGWHLPSREEWLQLGDFVFEAGVAAKGIYGEISDKALGKALASDNSDEIAPKWMLPEMIEGQESPAWIGINCELNNSLLFDGIPVGFRACFEEDSIDRPLWNHACYSAGWWSATQGEKIEPCEQYACPVRMWSDQPYFVINSEFRIDCALPVRCLKDK